MSGKVSLERLTFKSVVGVGDELPPRPAPPKTKNAWFAGLCSCLAYPWSCINILCCEACAIGQAVSIAKGGSSMICLAVTAVLLFVGILYFSMMFVSPVAATLLGLLLAFGGCGLALFSRMRIREAQDIGGSVGEDALLSLCCTPCSVRAPHPLPFASRHA
jgi:Cys-rich protein (TIGR01571 family)